MLRKDAQSSSRRIKLAPSVRGGDAQKPVLLKEPPTNERDSRATFFDASGWPDHSTETWYEWLSHKVVVSYLLTKWALQLIIAAGPLRLVWWVIHLFRIVTFVLMLLLQVFIPMLFHYCTSGCILRDVPYDDNDHDRAGGRSVLDIYLPKPAYAWISRLGGSPATSPANASGTKSWGTEPRPVAIFLVGGAWMVGYKGWGALLARLLSAAGVICFVPDYRNFPQATISDMVFDTNLAISWVLQNLKTYGGDPSKVILIGQSAGAHLGMTTLLDQHLKKQAAPSGTSEWNPEDLFAFVGISGPYDIAGLADFFQSRGLYKSVVSMIFEGSLVRYSPFSMVDLIRSNAAQAQPQEGGEAKVSETCSLSHTLPPMYFFHGTSDASVPDWSSRNLVDKLRSRGFRVTCKLLPGHSHTAPIIEGPVGGDDPLMADLLYLFCCDDTHGQLPPTGGFTGSITQEMDQANVKCAERTLAEVSKLVPKASKLPLALARTFNPF